MKDRILQQGSRIRFLSWLIYGSLNAAIHSPLSFAISRTLESGTDAGGAAARLADLPGEDLAKLLWNSKKRLESGYLGRSY
ncbi:MAG: hypothetical protein WA110_05780, partial [Anaerolineaceae bacterium]